MANPDKGEHEVMLSGRTFTLCYSMNAIRELETVGGTSLVAMFVEFANGGRQSLLQTLIWGGLRKFHKGLSLTDVGDLLDDTSAEDMTKLGEGIAQAIQFRLAALGIKFGNAGAGADGN